MSSKSKTSCSTKVEKKSVRKTEKKIKCETCGNRYPEGKKCECEDYWYCESEDCEKRIRIGQKCKCGSWMCEKDHFHLPYEKECTYDEYWDCKKCKGRHAWEEKECACGGWICASCEYVHRPNSKITTCQSCGLDKGAECEEDDGEEQEDACEDGEEEDEKDEEEDEVWEWEE